jgi:enamine deaminase RidA (YjgF/YER057c/UK114 family)
MCIYDNLKKEGLELPKVSAPLAAYLPAVQHGNLIYVSGQLPMQNGAPLHLGIVGDTVSTQEGVACARLCALHILAVLHNKIGDLNKIEQFVHLQGFVAATSAYRDHPAVINGASELLVKLLGEKGRHSRVAMGVKSLPLGVPVEIAAQVAICES